MNLTSYPLNYHSSEKCSICLDPVDEDVVAHSKNGEKHPFHRICIKDWVIRQPNCPVCRIEINPFSALSKTEKFFHYSEIVDKKIKYGWLMVFFRIGIIAFSFSNYISTNAKVNIICLSVLSAFVDCITKKIPDLQNHHSNIKKINALFMTILFIIYFLNWLNSTKS